MSVGPSTPLIDDADQHGAPADEEPIEPGAHVGKDRIGGLDGLRAVAVLAVVAFHLWRGTVPGGYLGVDLFMVLSGYLITGLLIDERARHGAVRLGAFWARRFRRLVPALLAVLVAVSVLMRLMGPATLESRVRGQGLASLFYVGNWKLISDATSYGALTNPPSPLLHLWSLAIEEQFYVVWPLVVVGVLALTAGRRRVLALVTVAGALASIDLMAALFDPDKDPLRLYYGTDTRAQAFLIGALGVLLARRIGPSGVYRWLRWIALPALVAIVAMFFFGDVPGFLYRGGFALFALLSVIAVMGVTVPGPVTRLVDRAPLRVIGRVSYGLYLWHWPVIVFAREDTIGLSGVSLLAVRLFLMADATAISWFLIEVPYRRADRRHAVPIAVAGMAVAAVSLLTMSSQSVLAYANVDPSQIGAPTVVDPPAGTATVAGTPKTVMILGDSGMYDAAPALQAGFVEAGTRVVVAAYPGEGLTEPPGIRTSVANDVQQFHPDLVLVMLGGWDQGFAADQGDAAYQTAVDDSVATLTAGGAKVLWLSVLPGQQLVTDKPVDGSSMNRFYEGLPARYPAQVDYLDITAGLRAGDGTFPRTVDGHLLRKPDGWHLCPDGASTIAHAVLTHLGIDRPEWESGPWRSDPRFNDPAGGCPR